MKKIPDNLYKEIVILHSCFKASPDELESIIHDPQFHKFTREGGGGIEWLVRKGNVSEWWYFGGFSLYGTEKDPFISKFETASSKNDDDIFTEIKIVCSNNPLLIFLFKRITKLIFRSFEEKEDWKRTIQYTDEPRFSSLAEILIQDDLEYREVKMMDVGSVPMMHPTKKYKKRKPGRKPNPDYDIAFDMTLEGKSDDDAFEWYCSKTGIVATQNNRGTFISAMKNRKRIWNEENK